MSKNKKKFQEIAGTRKLNQRMRTKFDSVVGNLYTFKYSSKTATDSNPTIIAVYRAGGGRLFTAKNGNKYMAGININNLSPTLQRLILERLQGKKRITYNVIKSVEKGLKAQYRVYRYLKVQNLSLLNVSKYLETL
jgi:hypothetical protein